MTEFVSSKIFGTERPVAFVTGSTSNRVGRVIALRLLARGYRVCFHAYRSVSEGQTFVDKLKGDGEDVHFVAGSIAEEVEVKGWVESIVDRFGRLDVLVHSAAVWEPTRLEDTTADTVREQWSSNTLGSFLCAQHVGLAMVKQSHGGAIVLIGDWAIIRPYSDFAAYFASKGSIPTLTRTFAVELAERHPRVRVNSILPGPVMLDDRTPKETEQRIMEQCLLRRAGTADDVARAAEFLVEHEFITGVCLPVDGGRSVYAGNVGDAIAHPTLFNPNFPFNRAKPETP